MADFTRKDTHQTSTGVGHHYRPGYYFPSTNFRSVLRDPLPPELVAQDEILKPDRFKTTTGAAHDEKHQGIPYGNLDPLYKKAPGHWKIDYGRNVHEKLGSGGHRQPLTMGNQTSETHGRFKAEPDTIPVGVFEPHPQGFNLGNHHTEGPSKRVYPNTENEKMKGKVFYPKDKEVMRLNDPYISTTHKDHHQFTPKDLGGVAKKDAATYWQCEDYPKAWGHGMKHNPVPKDSVPRENLPMRDPIWFKSATKIRNVPRKLEPVPHSGLKSQYKDSFQLPNDVKGKEAEFIMVDPPYTLPEPGPKSAFAAPQMYRTEYKNIGSDKVITV